MTFGELKREIARLEKNDWVDDDTEVLVENGDGHLIEFHDIYSYTDPWKEGK